MYGVGDPTVHTVFVRLMLRLGDETRALRIHPRPVQNSPERAALKKQQQRDRFWQQAVHQAVPKKLEDRRCEKFEYSYAEWYGLRRGWAWVAALSTGHGEGGGGGFWGFGGGSPTPN